MNTLRKNNKINSNFGKNVSEVLSQRKTPEEIRKDLQRILLKYHPNKSTNEQNKVKKTQQTKTILSLMKYLDNIIQKQDVPVENSSSRLLIYNGQRQQEQQRQQEAEEQQRRNLEEQQQEVERQVTSSGLNPRLENLQQQGVNTTLTQSAQQRIQQTNPLNQYRNNITGNDPLSVQKKLNKNTLNKLWGDIQGVNVSSSTPLLENLLKGKGYNLSNQETKQILNKFIINKSEEENLKRKRNQLLAGPSMKGLVNSSKLPPKKEKEGIFSKLFRKPEILSYQEQPHNVPMNIYGNKTNP